MLSKNPIFIMGMPRSGTSITAYVLGQHPQIQYHFEETNIFNLQLEKLFKSPYRGQAVAEYVAWMMGKNLSPKEQASLQIFEEEALSEDELGPVVRRFFDDCLLTEKGCTTFVEKTPLHIFYVDLIRRVYPDAIFLIPRRDKQQVIESMKKKAWSPESEVAREVFFDIIENEIYHVINHHKNIYEYEIEDFCFSPIMLIDKLYKMGIPEDGMDKVVDAHNKRVNKKYLTQKQEEDNDLDRKLRMAWNDPNQVNAELTL